MAELVEDDERLLPAPAGGVDVADGLLGVAEMLQLRACVVETAQP